MKLPRVLLPLLLLALPILNQCASASQAPAEESDAAKTFEAPDNSGIVFLYRPGRAVGAASAVKVKVNGLDAGGTTGGSFFRWELKPGKHTFFSSTGESSATVAIDVEAGNLYFIEQVARIGLNEGRVTMKQVDEEAGKKAVKSLKLLVSAYVPD